MAFAPTRRHFACMNMNDANTHIACSGLVLANLAGCGGAGSLCLARNPLHTPAKNTGLGV